jgi:hypothetical protein
MLYYLTIIVILFSIILLPFFQFSKRKNSVLNSNNLILLFFIGGIYELIFTILLGYDSQIWFKIYSYLEFLTLLLFFRKLIGITQSVFYFIIILYSIIYAFLAVMFFNKININLFELFIPIAE